MKRLLRVCATALLALAAPLCAADSYVYLLEGSRVGHVDANARTVGRARLTTRDVRGSHATYTDAANSIVLLQPLNAHNLISWELGYQFLRLDWEANPRFKQKDFHNLIASLWFTSTSLDRWLWKFNLGTIVNALRWNFVDDAVYYGLMWGRYAYTNCVGLHIGCFGYAGMRNGYLLPVLGFDWTLSTHWQLNAIFPFDASLLFCFATHWRTGLSCSSFGGPYRMPRRVEHGEGRFKHALLEIFATGAEWLVKYEIRRIVSISAACGWNFGGWILIKDASNRAGQYFAFDGAPYGRINCTIAW